MYGLFLTDAFLLESSPKKIYNALKNESCSINLFYKALSSILKKGHFLKVESIAQFFLDQTNILHEEDSSLEASMSTLIAYSKQLQKEYEACISISLPFLHSEVPCKRKMTMAFLVAGAFKAQKQYDKAFEYNNKIIEWLPQKKITNEEKKILITALFNIGNLFSLTGDTNKAEKYYEQGAQLIIDVSDYHLKSLFNSNYALIKYKNGKMPYQDVLTKLEDHISYCESSGDVHKYALASITRIDLLIEGKRYKEAECFLEKNIKFNFNLDIAYAVARLKIYFYTERYEQFLELLEEKIDSILNEKSEKVSQEIISMAVDYYAAKKDFEKYHYYSQLLIRQLKKTQIKEHKKKLVQLEAGVKLGLKEQQLSWLKQLNETEQKHNLALSKKNKELQDFASITAHDLRSPIRTINSFISILNRTLDLDSESEELFEFIRSAGITAKSLIDDLLDFARSGSYRIL